MVFLVAPPTWSEPGSRIVSLAPHTTELALAAGGSAGLVAAVPADSPLPPHTQRLSAIGGMDRELLLSLRPDLVLAWKSGNRQSDLAWLRAQGIPTHLSEPTGVEAIAAEIRTIGRLIGSSEQADVAAQKFIRSTRSRCASLVHGDAYIEVWDRPAMSIGGGHWLNDALSYAGFRNFYQQVPRTVFHLDPESLLSIRKLPRIRLRDGSELGSALLGRPGPKLGIAIQQLCEQRLSPSGQDRPAQ